MSENHLSGSTPLRVYQPRARRGLLFHGYGEMARDLSSSRELIWRLFVRDFSARYKQTLLGVLWAVIMPLVMVGTFWFLNRSGVLNLGDLDLPYAAYALLGLAFWQIFAGGLVAASNSIVSGGSMVVKINFPKESLVIASLGQTLVETLVRLALVVIVFIYYQIVPAWTALLVPAAIIPLLLLTLGLGFLLSLLNALFRDIANIVTVAVTFLLFLTPVLYPPPAGRAFQLLNQFNPLSPLVTGPRDLVIVGHLTDPVGFAWAGLASLAVFLLSWRLFHLAQARMTERMGAR